MRLEEKRDEEISVPRGSEHGSRFSFAPCLVTSLPHRLLPASSRAEMGSHRMADNPSIAQIEELPHLAELLVARSKQFPDGLIRQRRQLAVQHFIQKPRRPFMVGMRAAFRLRHNFLH